MGVNGLSKTVTRQRCGCNLNIVPSAPESSTLTTRLPSHSKNWYLSKNGASQEAIESTHKRGRKFVVEEL